MTPRYSLRPRPDDSFREVLKEYDALTQDLLAMRDITDEQNATAFLQPDFERDTRDPFLLSDMDKAVARTRKAIKENECIGVYTDFDADGIPAGALLHDLFTKIGHENFINYIPHRDSEGYGLHKSAIEKLKEEGVTLLLTADVGIADIESVAYANELGVDVIVTDHHIPGEVVPEAAAIVNPHCGEYPFVELCGTGVAFKFAQALLFEGRVQNDPWVEGVPEGWEKWLLDLVAIATVADMMALVDENRALVHYGLIVLRKSRRPGVAALCKKLSLPQSKITEDDIGFSIAPRINAASRMDSPEKAFELLTTSDPGRAADIAAELESLNNKRKAHVASIVRDLKKRFEENNEAAVLVAGNPKWNPALLGLAANSLVDVYGKTVCVWGREGTGSIKGSCRGAGDVNVVELFHSISDVLTQYGGHEHAGGFSTTHEGVHSLSESFNEGFKKVQKPGEDEVVFADAELTTLPLSQTYRTISEFAPFGIENPKPLFLCKNIEVQGVRQFGRDDAHVEVLLAREGVQEEIRAIAFFKSPDSFTAPLQENTKATLVCTLEQSHFAGRTRLELRIVDSV